MEVAKTLSWEDVGENPEDRPNTPSASIEPDVGAPSAASTPQSSRPKLRMLLHTERVRLHRRKVRLLRPLVRLHARIPYLRTIPFRALLIIFLLLVVQIVVWVICALIILLHYPKLISTCALAWTLGLRHALDADHISAIDLMTRRLIASGQRPVTVGTFFSLGHSTIVVITSIVVAATAAGISHKFNGISTVGNIVGSAVSASFLILLGILNGYILYKLVHQIRKIIYLPPDQASTEGFKVEGKGPLFRILRTLFRLIDRPWKMYPLGVMFGLGFDTSSEIALLGISSIQGAKGTSIWLILIFPVMFTAGMCLVDTIDGALMFALYIKPMQAFGPPGMDKKIEDEVEVQDEDDEQSSSPTASTDPPDTETGLLSQPPGQRSPPSSIVASPSERDGDTDLNPSPDKASSPTAADIPARAKDPLSFLYYSIILTSLTVVVALVIGTIQLLTLLLGALPPRLTEGRSFWDGVAVAGDQYEVIGAGICGSFVVVGLLSVLAYRPWRRWVDRKRAERGSVGEEAQETDGGGMEIEGEEIGGGGRRNEERDVDVIEEIIQK